MRARNARPIRTEIARRDSGGGGETERAIGRKEEGERNSGALARGRARRGGSERGRERSSEGNRGNNPGRRISSATREDVA